LVGLAKRLEGKPFHLVASHNQNGRQQDVVGYIRSKGLALTTPNVSVTSFGGHPKVKGNGFVPYYMVFNQHGELVYHHMSGAFHGGDGLHMIELVDQLIKEAQSIYLGKAPFKLHAKLADRIAKKKKLAAAVKELESLAAASRENAELTRLSKAVVAYRDRSLAQADQLMASNPPGVLPLLKELAKEFKGTKMGEPVDAKYMEMLKAPDLKTSIKIWKSFQKVVKRIDKLKDPSKSALAKQASKLDKLVAGHESLPVTKTILDFAALLRGS